jgi:hypothetical protein
MPDSDLGNAITGLENTGLIDENLTLRELRDRLGEPKWAPAAGMVVAWDRYVLVVARPGQPSDDPIPQVLGEEITLDTKVSEFLQKLKNADLSGQSGAIALQADSVIVIR